MKKIKSTLLTICIAFAMIFTALSAFTFTVFADNEGLEPLPSVSVTIDTGASVTLNDVDGDGYYDIGTADELYAFAALVNGNTLISNGGTEDDDSDDVYTSSTNGELTANIVVNENVLAEMAKDTPDTSSFRIWTPIGREWETRYEGTFTGRDFTVSGLYFESDEESRIGLFGQTNTNSLITNVGIIDSYLRVYTSVGAVVGKNYGTVEFCYSRSNVVSLCGTGGVVGGNYGKIEHCYNAGAVRCTYANGTGGVAGFNSDDGIVTNCYNTGDVFSVGIATGGIVGQNNSDVTYCYNSGSVTTELGESYTTTGGITGNNTGYVYGCYNTGTVSGCAYVGGIVGWNDDGGAVERCYNTASVTGTRSGVGGIVGVNGDTWGNKGTVLDCYNSGAVSGYERVGGLVGDNMDSAVQNSYNAGNVTSNQDVVGGLVGVTNANWVTNCFYLKTDSVNSGLAGMYASTVDLSVDESRLASGEIAYLLNGGVTDGTQAWYQNLSETGGDATPVLIPVTSENSDEEILNTVYRNGSGICTSITYSYSNVEDNQVTHDTTLQSSEYYNEDGSCKNCGGYMAAKLTDGTGVLTIYFSSAIEAVNAAQGMTGSIVTLYVPDNDGSIIEASDTEGDGIYVSTTGEYYIIDQDGDGVAEKDTDRDGVYEDANGGYWLPLTDIGNGLAIELTDDNEDGIYEDISGNKYVTSKAIERLQQELDDAQSDLLDAITDGDESLSDKITALNEALSQARSALEAADSASKSELTAKIEEADVTLRVAINALTTELNNAKQALEKADADNKDALEAKAAELAEANANNRTFIIIVCVISSLAFLGCVTIAVFYFIIDKKRV